MPTGTKAAPVALEANGAPEKDLTPKERIFIAEYLKDSNGARSAIAAGYATGSAHVTASRMLSRANVSRYLESSKTKLVAKIEISAERIANELALIAFGRMGRLCRVTSGGHVEFTPTDELEEEGLDAGIQSYTETTTKEGGSIGMKMHDKIRALELLGKYSNMWDKKPDDETDRPARGSNYDAVEKLISRAKGQ